MREARWLISEDQMKESSMESRITAIETDLRNFKESVKENIATLFDGMKSMNHAITQLLAGQEELRGEIKTLRAEVQAEIGTVRAEVGTLRAEVKAGIGALRAEVGTLRAEVQAEIGTVRAEMGTLRAEMRAETGTLRAEMGTLREEMHGALQRLETKIIRWFVATALSCAGLAFAAARLAH